MFKENFVIKGELVCETGLHIYTDVMFKIQLIRINF